MSRIALGALCAVILGAALSAQAQTASTTDTTYPTSATSTIATTTHSAFDPYNPTDVEAAVRSYFADIPVMVAIARCESGFEQYDAQGLPLYGGTGGMVGVFQEAAAIHGPAAKAMGLDINTLSGNLAYARHLYEEDGTTPWLASSGCWDPAPLKSTLSLGSTGAQVVALQRLLNSNGFVVAKEGPGSPGQESSYFGAATLAAVKKFQCAQGIACSGSAKTTGYGMVGAKTRLALHVLDAKHGGSAVALNNN